MRWLSTLSLCLIASLPFSAAAQSFVPYDARSTNLVAVSKDVPALAARVVAVGIRGAGGVAPVGFFHHGGPIHDKPEFAEFTKPGRVLDATRVLVTSNSNFGAPRALKDSPEGSVLSIDPGGPTIVVPAGFAAAGNQASALNGRVQLFTAQSQAFLNSIRTPGAASAAFPTVSNPLGISINNAFGRLWFANAPGGAQGIGTESIADPSGEPLAGSPSELLGGVFAGALTNRPQQIIPGTLNTGAVATALLGASPDGSKRAVFAVLTADGALAQAHTEFALDGLAPAGTVAPILLGGEAPSRATRAGMIFNWVPNKVLFVTEAARNAITALTLTTDDKVFRVQSSRRFTPRELDVPIDLAPVVPEVVNPGFSSNTTLAGNSDIYVANRGNGTIVRMRQDGTVVAVRRVTLPGGRDLGPDRLNGIAVSADAQTIWVTISGALSDYPDAPGALLALSAFGSGQTALKGPNSGDMVVQGARLFRTEFKPEQGLGPLYNERSCVACHSKPSAGGSAHDGLGIVRRIGRFDGRSFDPLVGRGGPVTRERTVAELGVPCTLTAGPPPDANLISVRISTPLYGLGMIDTIPDEVIRAGAAAQQGPVKGRVNVARDAQGRERVGRFGWKADVPTLEQSVAGAFRNELGITNPIAPTDLVPAGADCGRTGNVATEDDGSMLGAVVAYVSSLLPPQAGTGPQHLTGERLFSETGCAMCHTPALQAGDARVPLYSDLLLHDLGPALNDGVVQGQAKAADWRTSPLWGLSKRVRFLHDGRATSIREATLLHDGEAAPAVKNFRQLAPDEQTALLAFLSAL